MMLGKVQNIADTRNTSMTGHSIGGGVTQILTVRTNLPFVAFNDPLIKNSTRRNLENKLRANNLPNNYVAQEPNFRLRSLGWLNLSLSDAISGSGRLHGKHIDAQEGLPSGTGKPFETHSMSTCYSVGECTAWSNINPFEALQSKFAIVCF